MMKQYSWETAGSDRGYDLYNFLGAHCTLRPLCGHCCHSAWW
jgi:hypothetical protein